RCISLRRLHLVKCRVRFVQLVLEHIRQRHHAGSARIHKVRCVLSPAPPASQQPNPHRRVRLRTPHPRRGYKHHPSHRPRPANKLPPPHARTRHLNPPKWHRLQSLLLTPKAACSSSRTRCITFAAHGATDLLQQRTSREVVVV